MSGTGASCIYPLLSSALHGDWRFTATDVDPESIEAAQRNVHANGLDHRITVVRAIGHDHRILSCLACLPLTPRVVRHIADAWRVGGQPQPVERSRWSD